MEFGLCLERELNAHPFISLSDAVYNVIFKFAACQHSDSETRLNISAIAKEMNISRTPVFAAVQRLEADGIVSFVDKKFFISPFNEDEGAKIHVLRAKLEADAIRKTALYADAGDIKRILFLNQKLRAAYLAGCTESILARETEFHSSIVRLCRNPYLISAYEQLLPQISRCQKATLIPIENTEIINQQHDLITRALRFRNPEVCAAAVLEHLSSAPAISGQLKKLCTKPEPSKLKENYQ